MKSNSQDFTFSILCEPDKIADHLEALAGAFCKGFVSLTSGDETLDLKPEGDIDFYLRAYRRGTRNKVSFDLRWANHPDTMIELNIKSDSGSGKE